MSIDYPRAFEIARAAPMEAHHKDCSYRICRGGLLCDCDVIYQHPEYLDDVLQTRGGVPYEPTEGAPLHTKGKR